MLSCVFTLHSFSRAILPFTRAMSTSDIDCSIGGSSSSKKKTHPERTSSSFRSEVFRDVEVVEIEELSPTVKGYALSAKETTPRFKAGQWLDVQVPTDPSVIGGYSLTCSPSLEKDDNQFLSLAIQYSDHPPTHWMSSDCKVGDVLKIRVGGDFYYDPTPSSVSNLLLIAGGIGINPIFSIFQHQFNMISSSFSSIPRAHLLYSARNSKELIFKDAIIKMCNEMPNQFSSTFFTTRETQPHASQIKEGRISLSDCSEVFKFLPLEETKCFICGPPPFIADMTEGLKRLGVREKENIYYEKWW